jgi:hypothetical protein
MDRGLLAIAHHLACHGKLFVEPGREPRLDANLFLRKIRDPVPTTNMEPDLIRSRF